MLKKGEPIEHVVQLTLALVFVPQRPKDFIIWNVCLFYHELFSCVGYMCSYLDPHP